MEFVMPILEGAWRYVLTRRVSDYLDIALMAYAIYWLLKLVGTSKVESVGKVILLFLLALMLSDAFSLNGIYFLLSHILSLGALALIVLFQPEIRRLIDQLGSSRWRSFNPFARTQQDSAKVFANAQTGNIVLMSTHLFAGDWAGVFRYFVPLISFMAGIFVAECVHRRYKCMEKVHWRQLIILAEIVLLFFVGFLPQEVNTFANALVSFVCAMQVQTFRKVRGHAYASTMCSGNMRSGTEALCAYFHTHDREVLKKALTYFGVIGIFAVGAGLGSVLTARFAEKGIWVSCLLLAVSFLMMFVREEEKK